MTIYSTQPPPSNIVEESVQSTLWTEDTTPVPRLDSRPPAVTEALGASDDRAYHVHKETSDNAYRIICRDNREALECIPSDSVDLVVTSPPYFQQRQYTALGLGNEDTIDEYLDNILTTFEQLIRVVKPTGNIIYNMGDKIHSGGLQLVPYRFAIRVVDELGLKLVNDITWVKSNPTPHQFNRRLVNSTEPFFHFALSQRYYYDRASFLPSRKARRTKPTNRLGSKYRELIDASDLTHQEKMAANHALDEVIEEVRNGSVHSFRMKIRGIHAPAYGGQDGGRKMHIERDGFTIIRISGEPMKKDVIENPVESRPGNLHPAVFPVPLIQELIRLLCPPCGLVLDPYAGSGSTVVAALREGRDCIGIDISQEYCDDALNRLVEEPID